MSKTLNSRRNCWRMAKTGMMKIWLQYRKTIEIAASKVAHHTKAE